MFEVVVASLLAATAPVVQITVINEAAAPVIVAVEYMEQPVLTRRTLEPLSTIGASLAPQQSGALTVFVGEEQRAYAIPRGLERGQCGSINVFVGKTVRADGAIGGTPWATHGCVDVELEPVSAVGELLMRAPVQEPVCFALSPSPSLDQALAAALPKVVTLRSRAVAFWSDAERTVFVVEPAHVFFTDRDRHAAIMGHRTFAHWSVDVDKTLQVTWSTGFESLTLAPASSFTQLLEGTSVTAPFQYRGCADSRDEGIVTMKRVPCGP